MTKNIRDVSISVLAVAVIVFGIRYHLMRERLRRCSLSDRTSRLSVLYVFSTVVDGEVVALDQSGFPNFNLLQNYRSEASRIHFFVFDLLVYKGRDLTRLPLIEQRDILRSVLKFDSDRIRVTDYLEPLAADMLHAVRQQGLEGIIGKKKEASTRPASIPVRGSTIA